MRAQHKWETGKQTMLIEEESSASLLNVPPILTPYEAEHLVENLMKFEIEDVGNSKWLEQHESIEKLNLQAHQNAMTNSDEYVLEALLTFDKIDVLIHDLLIIEAWKENVYQKLIDFLAGRNTMRLYFILYHEATLVNFLEVLFYHKHVCESIGEKMIELVDYSARKLTRLNGGYDFRGIDPDTTDLSAEGAAKEFADKLAARTPLDECARYLTEIEFRVCISATAIGRFICENADILPLSVVSRITDTHDLLMLFIPLIENPPWTRRLPSTGRWQKLIDHKWMDVQPIDLLKITKLEGQPWLALYHLVAKKEFRERYNLNSFRKGQLLRVRKYINDVLLDQLPVLADIQRYMDELALQNGQESIDGTSSVFLFQQVSEMREALLRGKNWEEVAEFQKINVFTMTDKTDKDIRRFADLYADDTVGQVIEPETIQDSDL